MRYDKMRLMILSVHWYFISLLLTARVEGFQTVNVALQKPTRQIDGTVYVSSFGVDGNTDPHMGKDGTCPHTESVINTWWVVDLLERYPVYSIRIYNRQGDYHLFDFYVYISEKNPVPNLRDLSLPKLGQICFWYEGVFPHLGVPEEVTCNDVVIGRYVYIWKPSVEKLNFCELNVLVKGEDLKWRSTVLTTEGFGINVKYGWKSSIPAFVLKVIRVMQSRRPSLMLECVVFCLSESEASGSTGFSTVMQVKSNSGLCECVQKSSLLEGVPGEVAQKDWILMELASN